MSRWLAIMVSFTAPKHGGRFLRWICLRSHAVRPVEASGEEKRRSGSCRIEDMELPEVRRQMEGGRGKKQESGEPYKAPRAAA